MIESEKTIIINMLTRPATEGGNNLAGRKQIIKACLVNDHGTWTVRGRFAEHPGDKPRLHSKTTGFKVEGHNKRRAEAAMRLIVEEWEKQINTCTPLTNPKLKDRINQWLDRKKLTIRDNTMEGYRVAARAHIIPELGDISICDLTRQDIRNYYEKLHRDGLSVSTLKKHRVIIQGVLRDAILDDIISVNVADNISLPKGKKFEGNALSETQVVDMLDKLGEQPEPIRAAVMLAVVYGLRRSEICGLRWEDIDFENSIIRIRNTVTEFSGTVYEVEDTKTKTSCRDLYLIPSVADYLKALLQTQKQQGIYSGKVCVHLDGRMVKPEYCTRACMRFLRACGYDGVRLHDLRGTATTILARRVPMKQVQGYLGHKDVQTTMRYYVHLMNEDKIATAEAMGKFLAGAGFLSACSERCSESTDNSVDNIIPIHTISPDKSAIR